MASLGLLVLRLALGVVFFAHGAHILVGAWATPGAGPGGLTATSEYYVTLGLSPAMPLAVVAGLVQLAGGLLLGFGLFARWTALALLAYVLVGVWTEHRKWGFFLNWTFAANQHHGVEYSLVLGCALVALFLTGPGDWSVDGYRANNAASRAAGRARLRGKM
jgi:putative oxidoreductase